MEKLKNFVLSDDNILNVKNSPTTLNMLNTNTQFCFMTAL